MVPGDEPVRQGGDPACWIDRTCPECGYLEDGEPPPVCPRCGFTARGAVHAETPSPDGGDGTSGVRGTGGPVGS